MNNNFNSGFGGFNPDTFFQTQFGGQEMANDSLLQQTYNFGATPSATLQNGATTIELRKLYMGLTRPQGLQARRSYDVLLDGKSDGVIRNQIEQYGADALSSINIGKMMSEVNIIRHSGVIDDTVDIVNGWETDRFRFTMIVDIFRNGKFQRTEFISGHTDHAGVTNAGLISSVTIDPNMVLTINHVTEARQRMMDANGRPIALISRSNSVMRNNSFGGLGVLSNSLYMTRPSDILRAVDKIDIHKGMIEASQYGDTTFNTYQDLDSTLAGVPMMSSDTSMLLPTFTSRAVKGLYESTLNQFDPMNMDDAGGGTTASARVQDTPFSASGFVNVMNRRLANSVTTTAQFRYGDLLQLDPTIDDRTEVFGRSYESGTIVIPDGRDVASLGAAETIAVHGTAISQATIALMSMAGVATLAYHADNHASGMAEITFQAADGLDDDGMLSQRLENLRIRLMMECLNIVSENNEITYELDVFADAFNDVYVQLVWDGIRRDYVFPAFASAVTAPTVTKDLGRLNGIAEGISSIVSHCKEIVNPGMHGDSALSTIFQGDGNARIGGLTGDF